jgi:hypothetical protein
MDLNERLLPVFQFVRTSQSYSIRAFSPIESVMESKVDLLIPGSPAPVHASMLECGNSFKNDRNTFVLLERHLAFKARTRPVHGG